MQELAKFPATKIKFLFTDIDDTITTDGQLPAESYAALWKLSRAGISVVPVTGRPAGWCEMIARFWPVAGVVGENGGLYFRYHHHEMKRVFFNSPEEQKANRKKLDVIAAEVLREVPGCAIASDQFCRMLDLAVDFAEDVKPLPPESVARIVTVFERHGAQAKVSSIHVNGWFGAYDKLFMCKKFIETEFGLKLDNIKGECTFVGDSPNDEPMWQYFPVSFAVANVQHFVKQIKHLPSYVASREGGEGFVEIAEKILKT